MVRPLSHRILLTILVSPKRTRSSPVVKCLRFRRACDPTAFFHCDRRKSNTGSLLAYVGSSQLVLTWKRIRRRLPNQRQASIV